MTSPSDIVTAPQRRKLPAWAVLLSIFVVFIAGLLVLVTPYRRRYGQLFGLMAVLNGLARLGSELIRRDTEAVFLGLTMGQVGALAVFAGGAALMAWASRRGEAVPGQRGG